MGRDVRARTHLREQGGNELAGVDAVYWRKIIAA